MDFSGIDNIDGEGHGMGTSSGHGMSTRSHHKQSLMYFLKSHSSHHCAAADVRIHVGRVGYIKPTCFLIIGVLMVYLLSTTNIYLAEEPPIGTFALWAEGDIRTLSQQQENGSLCRYMQKYDYVFEKDSEWQYTAIGCRSKPRTSIVVKENAGKALYFATYEQLHKSVRVHLNRSEHTCDHVCKRVYPEWPSAGAYGNRSWLPVHVKTPRYQSILETHPDLGKVAQMHLKKPSRVGRHHCYCDSYENNFLLGVEDAKFALTYSYDSYLRLPGSSKSASNSDPMTFFVAKDAKKPFKVFGKASYISLSLEELLDGLGTCLDCRPDDGSFRDNKLCPDGVCGPEHHAQPHIRLTGMLIDVRSEVYSHRKSMPEGPGYEAFKHISANYEPPYAIFILTPNFEWASHFSETAGVTDRVQMTSYRYGVYLRVDGIHGKMSAFSIHVLIDTIVKFYVLVQFPLAFTSFVVFYLLGRRSAIYRRGKRKHIKMHDMYSCFALSLLRCDIAFKSLDIKRLGCLRAEDIATQLSDIVVPLLQKVHPAASRALLNTKVREFVNYYIISEASEGSEASGIMYTDFMEHALKFEPLQFSDVLSRIYDHEEGSLFLKRSSSKEKVPSDSPVATCSPGIFIEDGSQAGDLPSIIEKLEKRIDILEHKMSLEFRAKDFDGAFPTSVAKQDMPSPLMQGLGDTAELQDMEPLKTLLVTMELSLRNALQQCINDIQLIRVDTIQHTSELSARLSSLEAAYKNENPNSSHCPATVSVLASPFAEAFVHQNVAESYSRPKKGFAADNQDRLPALEPVVFGGQPACKSGNINSTDFSRTSL